VRDSCGNCETGETPEALKTLRRLNARPTENECTQRKSTNFLIVEIYLNSNKYTKKAFHIYNTKFFLPSKCEWARFID
jgi:hypothetical protein